MFPRTIIRAIRAVRSRKRAIRAVLRKKRAMVYRLLMGTVIVAAVGAAAIRSWSGLVVAFAALLVLHTGLSRELRRTQRRVRRLPRPDAAAHDRVHVGVNERVLDLERRLKMLTVALYDPARTAEQPGPKAMPRDLVRVATRAMVDRRDALDAHGVLVRAGSFNLLGLTPSRRLRNELRRRGYLTKALDLAQVCAAGGTEDDVRARAMLESEIAVLSGSFTPVLAPEADDYRPNPGRVVHLVGKSLPQSQAGYTLRTHYIAMAQRDAGVDPHVVTQMGFGHDGDGPVEEHVDGIPHHRIAGPARGSGPMDEWLDAHVRGVAGLVRELRPAVLHAASDFLNALTAQVVGKAFGVPVVYESRGFWEETWLSRQAREYDWDLDRLAASHGLPDAYIWRRDIEDRCRRNADRVVTLADVMADRIETGGVPRERIEVVSNAVDVAAFPVLRRNGELAAKLGIAPGATVIGYISSLVEYEGIDTLVAAYASIRAASDTPVALLIVGDGPERENLVQQATELGVDDVVFTGQVPHETVLDYYSVIDIFVVPRRPVEVCHLVTPLKPFEAFSTARTVVLSNVRALAGIADQSRAAELFEAGDELSLATVLLGLLKDPERRRELAAAGAAWVRAERTWAANAQVYLRLYQQIVPGDPVLRPAASARIDTRRLRQRLAKRGPIPFEELAAEDSRGGAERIMGEGWVFANHPAVRMDLPVDWTTLCVSNRMWAFRLHAWDFMAPVLRAFAQTEDRRYLDWCVDRALSWARTFNEGDARGTMAWYDMAIGLRGHRLAYLAEQALSNGVPAAKVTVLLDCVIRHQREFFADRAFNPGNNHGVYVAMGQLALARRLGDLPAMPALLDQGRARMRVMASTQFAADGGHLEHSPDYHRMLVDTFRGAFAANLLDDEEVLARITLAEEALGWFVTPNGEIAQIGDSPARQMRSQRPRTSSPTTEFLLSRGDRGAPNPEAVKVLPDTGYAIVRSPQPTGRDDHENANYLILAGGFHSRAHKHADDLTLTWFHQGQEILIDAGRYGYVDLLPKDSPLRQRGYYYSAPERQYVESTRAHNTVEADGADHLRRGREPYGSAIQDAEERDGHFRLRATVDHGHWRHQREVVFLPGGWMQVADLVTALDDAPHDYRVWWNFPEELRPEVTGPGELTIDLPAAGGRLRVVELGGADPISPVSAAHDPIRGWRSKVDLRLTPAWSTGFQALGVREHRFRTLFSFADQRPTAPFAHPFQHS